MANANQVPKLYRTVVEDVINNVRETFLDDGVDEQVLQELKQLWESKLQQSKAVEGITGEQDQVINAFAQHQQALQQQQQQQQKQQQIQQQVQQQLQPQQPQQTLQQQPHIQRVQPVAAAQAQPRIATIAQSTPTTTILAQPKGAYNMVQNMVGMARAPTLPLRHPTASSAPAPAHINVAPSHPAHPAHPAHQNHRGITLATTTLSGQEITQLTQVIPTPQPAAAAAAATATVQVTATSVAQLPAATVPTTQQPIYNTQTAAIGGLSSAAQAAALALPGSLYQQQFFQPGTIIQGYYNPRQEVRGHIQHHAAAPQPPPLHHHHHQHQQHQQQHQHPQHQQHHLSHHWGQDGTQYIIQAQPQVVTQQGTAANYTVQMPGMTTAQQLVEAQAQAQQAHALVQIDGTNDSSSEDDDYDDDKDDDDDDENEGNEENDEFQGEEEDPLNSGDDVSDEDPSELFDADNVVVCQFDKITRCKNRWKFQLKDGIMNLNGKDFVFHRAIGESEW